MSRSRPARPARRAQAAVAACLAAAWHALCGGAAAAQTPGEPDYATWDSFQGGAESSQYSSLDQIDRSNVANLELAWTYSTGERAFLFNPLVVDGTMYVIARDNTLVALNPATGGELWRKTHEGPLGARGMNTWSSEDGSDRRLLYVNAGFLTAVDARTGETIESFGEGGRVDLRSRPSGMLDVARPLHTNNPGRVFEDVIIMALPASAFAYASAPADIHAYDVRTGAPLWEFHVIPHPGEPGRETWPDNANARWGGGQSWAGSTVDVERGIVYVPTGTARFDFYGGNRHGDNLYANSVVALDARTGERLWHQQLVHHDLWDYDLPTSPKLLTVRRDGVPIDAVAQATKQGFVFVFDAATGEPVWPIEERPVPQSDAPGEQTSPTQPFSSLPPFARQAFTEADINPHITADEQAAARELLATYRNEGVFTPPSLQGSIEVPGHNGGANWTSVAVDPDAGLFYVVSKDLPVPAKLVEPTAGGPADDPPNAPDGFVAYRSPVEFMLQSNGLPAIGPPWSTITAYDLNAGTILWQVPNGGITMLDEQGVTDVGALATRGGPVVTAGGLMFIATATDRTLRARDVTDGSVLWEYELPAGSEGIPAVYEADGRQFVVVAVGGTGQLTFNLEQPDPGPAQYMAFALPE